MFGLTRREQCWAAEQQAAELIAGVAKAALLAKTEIAKADANAGLSAALAKVEVLTKDRDDCLDARIHYVGIYGEAVGQRDHLAQCLKFARTTMAVVANNANLRGVEHRSLIAEIKRIDAALSAVCAAAPNIATTSEHNGS